MRIITNSNERTSNVERFSRNREAIITCLRGTTIHPTAEWVFQQLKPDLPNLSLGTVYRNLCQLKEAGVIASMGVIAGQEHFDGDVSPHSHVMCPCCGRIDDIPVSSAVADAMHGAQSATGFAVTAARFVGLCPDCRPAAN